MTWVVVTQESFDAWVATTDPERDEELRVAVLNWVIGLADGPPARGILDPFSGASFAQVGVTDVWIRYFVLPDLDPPTIVIREYL